MRDGSGRILTGLFGVSFAFLATFGVTAGGAQAPRRADAEFLRESYARYQTERRESPFRDQMWSFLGPTNISGRSTDLAVADQNGRRRIYAAYATGGIWKTDDNGASWQAIFEDQASTSIGAIAVAPSNPEIVWAGTGESNIFRASMPGTGIYKSTDAGEHWEHMGLTDTQTIARVVVHPTNPDIVYVAASGHEWTDNEMRGVFKTTDGGRTWTKVLYRSPRTGAIDLVMDPSNPDTLYAATWQRIRRKWSDPRVEPGYNESGIFKTTDGGSTWTQLTAGLPDAQFCGRIGLDVAPSHPNVVYAFIDNYAEARPARPNEHDAYDRPIVNGRIKSAEIYRSDDAGATWRKTSETNDFMIDLTNTYGWVFGQIRIDPADENTIYVLGINLNVSHDAGKTFTSIEQPHGDNHDLWIDPANPRVFYNSNDGGFYSSTDAGLHWTFASSVPAVQFYDVALDTMTPFHAYGSIQDVGSRRGAIDLSRGRDALAPVAFEEAPGGEGSHHAIDPSNPQIVYSHVFYGNFRRTDVSGGVRDRWNEKDIRPSDPGDLRAQWMAPVILSPHDPKTVYVGFQFLFRSPSRGDTWEKISPDLTSNDPAQMLPRNASAVPYQTIVALSESPRRKGVLYAGTDDGHLQVTRDGGSEWIDLTTHLPTRKWISLVVASEHADGTVYVTQRGREDDDFAAYVYKSTDYGATFTSLAQNIAAGSVNVIREDPFNPNTLYVGTDFGVYISTTGGRRWEVLGGNLPSVQVSDIQYQRRDRMLVISTYGRGMWGMRREF
jgi:photosystem II stability/assembly factor-like uncharacterized protein